MNERPANAHGEAMLMVKLNAHSKANTMNVGSSRMVKPRSQRY